jgi:hypothetical protein
MNERIPARFRADVVRRIGHGAEATAYELDGRRVLRVFHHEPHAPAALAAFYREISAGSASFAKPDIIEQGEEGGVAWSLDRLIEAGRSTS